MEPKKLNSLRDDIYKVLSDGVKIDDATLEASLKQLGELLKDRLSPEAREPKGSLRFSNFAQPDRKLWLTVNSPEKAEPLEPWVYLKFMYGDVVEWLMMLLIKSSGHKVEGEQDTLNYHGVVGHRDGVVDGVAIDVKSANSRGFEKFKTNSVNKDDPFGYIDQLSLYVHADNGLVTDKRRMAFVAFDKEMGHVVVDQYLVKDIPKEVVERKQEVVKSPEMPKQCYPEIPHNKSGNMQLSMPCSYCSFKKTCFPHMRTFLYSGRPVHLTKIVKQPDVTELK